jgi:hypothetical protein
MIIRRILRRILTVITFGRPDLGESLIPLVDS